MKLEAQAKQLAELLKVLANENRLLILCTLMEGPLAVSQLCEKIGAISQPALSQHLALLKAHRIVESTRSGQWVTYFISDKRVEAVIELLKELYCSA
ncbi:MAG: winged helix-turn-helix transcriptional regulator [Firmicutes bacterium]|nr:winged helix-turn-helix transcriptional regulator [Bacillota bacterium]